MPRNQIEPRNVVSAFVTTINAHDAQGLTDLMTEDHMFIDSLGRSFKGREEMRKGWEQYFELFADYTITVADIFEKGFTFVLLGSAEGAHVNRRSGKQTKWKIPAAWKVVVRDGLVSQWQVFADNYKTMKLVSGA